MRNKYFLDLRCWELMAGRQFDQKTHPQALAYE